nr:MAG TPA: hypothetical protein [Caudoviricetes sp.]
MPQSLLHLSLEFHLKYMSLLMYLSLFHYFQT